MAKLTINGVEVEAEAGRRLVEVIKEQGIAITNLCYIDGLDPYAGCRTCLVHIEGGRPTPIQLSCIAQVAEGMVVTTDTPQIKQARQSVISLIDANHPDRCLTCHRRVHCMPGDICLRDDVVTHRCLTCSKNYRCELQTANELMDMGEFEEPWVGEARSYYESPPPEPDRANPFLEFDPQMCIICTRCVRACADLRHTTAISLAGKGFEARIAFGTGGAIHESDCDFCGACLDVCPTATLMEKPNKWIARADDWTSSVCNSCAVGCTTSYGLVDDRPVIVRPDRLNPFSRDQICVRGRFHYDAVSDRERATRHLVRRGANLLPASFDEAMQAAIDAVNGVKGQHGTGAIAVLGSPLASNEEAFALAALARAIGTPHLDFSHGPLHRAVETALRDALGVERRGAQHTQIEGAHTIVAAGIDLEESHNIVALRIKDAVTRRGAKLIVVSPKWNELVPFANEWLQPAPANAGQVLNALAQAIADDPAAADRLRAARVSRDVLGADISDVTGVAADALARAKDLARAGAASEAGLAVVFAPPPAGIAAGAAVARAAANVAIAASGAGASNILHYLPTDANVLGITDMGIAPGPQGKSFYEIIEAARAGEIRALVIHRDNPLLNGTGTDAIEAALGAVEQLIVIDSVRSTAAEHAGVLLAEKPFHLAQGTTTNAARGIGVNRMSLPGTRDERDGVELIATLANGLGARVPTTAAAVTDAIASAVASYTPWDRIEAGRTRSYVDGATANVAFQPAGAPAPMPAEGIAVLPWRSLYTSWLGASMRSEEADKLHRDEVVLINPRDAEAIGARGGDEVELTDGTHALRITVKLDDGVGPGWAVVPHYFDGGAVMQLLPAASDLPFAAVQVRALTPA